MKNIIIAIIICTTCITLASCSSNDNYNPTSPSNPLPAVVMTATPISVPSLITATITPTIICTPTPTATTAPIKYGVAAFCASAETGQSIAERTVLCPALTDTTRYVRAFVRVERSPEPWSDNIELPVIMMPPYASRELYIYYMVDAISHNVIIYIDPAYGDLQTYWCVEVWIYN
jgi:hypothetical protein